MKTKRKAYKSLYLCARKDAHEWKQNAEAAARELARLHLVMADEGARVLNAIPEGDGPIVTTALEYECIAARISTAARWASHNPYDYRPINLAFRGRPVRPTTETPS